MITMTFMITLMLKMTDDYFVNDENGVYSVSDVNDDNDFKAVNDVNDDQWFLMLCMTVMINTDVL